MRCSLSLSVSSSHSFLPLDLDPLTASGALHDVFRAVQQSLEAVLQGYHVPDELAPARTRALVAALFTVTVDPKLPLFQMRGDSFCPLPMSLSSLARTSTLHANLL